MHIPRAFSLLLLVPALTFAQPPPPSAAGLWLGTLHAGAHDLRLQIHLKPQITGAENCSLDSLDQHAFGLPCTVTVKGDSVVLVVPSVYGSFVGHLSADGKTLTGKWTQSGAALPLALQRETTAIGPTEASTQTPRTALAPHPNA